MKQFLDIRILGQSLLHSMKVLSSFKGEQMEIWGKGIFESHHLGQSSLYYPRATHALGNVLIWRLARKAREPCSGLAKGQAQQVLPALCLSHLPQGTAWCPLCWIVCQESSRITC